MHPEIHIGHALNRGQYRERSIALAVTLAVVVWILGWYWPTTSSMVGIWYRSDTFAHGFLIVPIVGLLIWRDRRRLAAVPIRPYAGALAGLALAGAGWMVAELASVLALAHFMLIGMIPLTVWAILGSAMARALAFPMLFLFFAVPFGEFAVPIMIDWTADFTVGALQATGVPVYREDTIFVIPTGTWSVVEACSGVRYLIASVVVGTLYAYLTYRSLSRRILFVGISIIVPLVANWLRAYLIVMIGHLSGNRLAVGVDHLIYGWVFFGLVMLLLFWIASFWREDHLTPEPRPSPMVTASLGTSASHVLAIAMAALLLASIWRPAVAFLDARTSTRPVSLAAIESANGWQPLGSQHSVGITPSFRPDFGNVAAETTQTFVKGDARVTVFVGFYRDQSQGRELVSQQNQLVASTNKQWIRIGSGVADVLLGTEPLRVRTAEVRGNGERLETWHWYWINGWVTTNDYVAKAYLGLARMLGRGDDSAVVVLHAPKADLRGSSATALMAFAAEMGAPIQRMLDHARLQ